MSQECIPGWVKIKHSDTPMVDVIIHRLSREANLLHMKHQSRQRSSYCNYWMYETRGRQVNWVSTEYINQLTN